MIDLQVTVSYYLFSKRVYQCNVCGHLTIIRVPEWVLSAGGIIFINAKLCNSVGVIKI